MVRFSLAAKYPSTEKLELTWKCGVCELFSFTLWSQNKMIFHKSSTANTQIFWKPVTAFHLLHLHFYFSKSWNTFSCHYLSFKILSTKISNLTLLSNFDGTERKRLQNVNQKYSIQVLEHFIFIFSVKQQPLNTIDYQTINKVQWLLMVSHKYLTVSLCRLT